MPSGTAGLAGRRVDARNHAQQAEQIVQQDEEQDAGDEGLEALIAVTDHLTPPGAGELVNHLGDLLRRVGILDRKRQPHDDEKQR